MNQKGFSPLIIILGIILVIGIASGAYYFGKTQVPKPQSQNPVITSQIPQTTPTPSPSPAPSGAGETANWKTYTNNYFTFKYPTDWSIYTYNKQGDPSVPVVRVACIICGDSSIIGFSVYDLSNDPWWNRVKFTSDQYVNHTERDPYKNVSDYQSMKVDGNDATEALILPKGGNGISTVEFFVPHGDKGYVLVYELQSPGNGRITSLKVFNPDILSTFKFTQ